MGKKFNPEAGVVHLLCLIYVLIPFNAFLLLMDGKRVSAAGPGLLLPCIWLISQFAFQAPSILFNSICHFFNAAVEECLSLSLELETGPASEVKMWALWVRRCMAGAALEALEGIERLSKVCVLTGSDWRESEVWMSILHNCSGTISCM